jgi:hypothetical protein
MLKPLYNSQEGSGHANVQMFMFSTDIACAVFVLSLHPSSELVHISLLSSYLLSA